MAIGVGCEKAVELTALATRNGWDAELEYGDDSVDVVLASNWKHPDTDEGWEWGAVLRYYRITRPSGKQTWSLGSLDNAGKRVVGGVARNVPSGPEFEYWLGSVKMLQGFIIDPADFVAWFEKVAPR